MPELSSEYTENNDEYSFLCLLIPGKEGKKCSLILQWLKDRCRGWEAGMKVFAGTQARSRTIEIIIDHGIGFFLECLN